MANQPSQNRDERERELRLKIVSAAIRLSEAHYTRGFGPEVEIYREIVNLAAELNGHDAGGPR